MKRFYSSSAFRALVVWMVLIGTLVPMNVRGCACGCGVFEVGTSSMFPTHEGGMAFLEYDYQHQDCNWEKDSPSAAENNGDKKIISNFFMLGYQYVFSRSWGGHRRASLHESIFQNGR